MRLIEFRQVSKSFNNREIIHNMNFSIENNEIIALLGENGAGKTTTIRMLLGIESPDSGEIIRWSENFNREVGVQLQTTPFFEDLDIEDNLKLFATFYQVQLSENEIDDILKSYNLYIAKKTKASKLSLGQQKRLALIITIIHQPVLVILDEPSAGLDPGGQRDVQRIIHKLKKQGKSVLFSSHDMNEIRNVADRVMILHEGKIIENDSPEKLLQKYKSSNLEELFYLLTSKEVN